MTEGRNEKENGCKEEEKKGGRGIIERKGEGGKDKETWDKQR
jgi:hypothetical protein